nr:hypothetical protein [uncultured Campylobacter sp.]
MGKVDIKPGFMASVKFDSAYLRIIIGILCFAACAFFAYLAFRSEKSIKYYPKFMRCKGCLKFYNFSDVKDRSICPKCGGELQNYAEIEKSDQIEKNKKLERYYKFEKEWLKRVQNRRDEE